MVKKIINEQSTHYIQEK